MRLRTLIHRHIEDAVKQEWPAMARQRATLAMTSAPLVEALRISIALTPQSEGQKAAQREIVVALQNALDARRQRIMISQSTVDSVKWTGLVLQALCTLVAMPWCIVKIGSAPPLPLRSSRPESLSLLC